MKSLGLDKVEEAAEFKKLPAGGYICRIVSVEDFPKKEYLKIEFDIASGEFKNHYSVLNDNKGFWGGNFIKSYKETAISFFKAFINRVEESNKNYKFDDKKEDELVGKFVGLVLSEEEYESNDGTIKTRLYASRIYNIEDIKAGNFKIPALKKVEISNKKNITPVSELKPIEDDSLPF